MATTNPFDLLGDDAEDVTHFVASALPQKTEKPAKGVPTQAQPAKSAKLPSKPVPPTQAVRDAKNVQGGSRGGAGRGGFSRGRGAGGFNREPRYNDAAGNENGFSGGYRPSGEGDAVRQSERRGGYGGPRGRGGRRGGFSESGDGERPRRTYERRSGTGYGSEFKREGSGRGNWGAPGDEIVPETEEAGAEGEKIVAAEKPAGEETAAEVNKETPADEPEEKEPEDKEMTLEEYEKLLEEKRKGLQASKVEGRKIDEKEFESMQQLSGKKSNDEIFAKLGSDKSKRKDAAEKEEKAKKSLSINEFLKPAEGENYYPRGGGRGRGRGRGRGGNGGNGGNGGGYYGGNTRSAAAPSIQDAAQFPSLGGK